MKKILLTIIIIASVTIAKAQTEKGTTYLGGSVSYRSTVSKLPSVSNRYVKELTLAPTIGWFVGNNWSIAITPTYISDRDSSFTATPFGGNSSTVTKSKYLGGSVDVRYYVNITPQFAFFPQLSGGYYGLIDNKNQSGNIVSVGISPNFAYFPTKHWAVNLGFGALQYRKESNTYKAPGVANVKSSSSVFDVTANSGLNLGVNYFFGK
jgi:hypothetical protein